MTVRVDRLPLELRPDPRRVITRFFSPSDVTRVRGIIERALAVPETLVESQAAELVQTFDRRHRDIRDVFAEHFAMVRPYLPAGTEPSEAHQLWIGACFTMEYAMESVALFNPSIVPAVSQDGAPPGGVRFLMSLRATGEGHISSIVFRSGNIDRDGNIQVDPPGEDSRPLRAVLADEFEKSVFRRDLETITHVDDATERVLSQLGERFTRDDLMNAIEAARRDQPSSGHFEECADTLVTASRVNYRLAFPAEGGEGEIVIFPFSDIERHGIEDLRLVRFREDDGSHRYYGTYTAYNGARVYPQLLEYQAGREVDISLITGRSAKNKGMALFPRRVHGRYAMIARLDNENLYYMESNDLRIWDEAQVIRRPKFPWEIIQIGNCGSPLETDAGWLLITHGVGPMRQYCIGATLLDRDDPTRVRGLTREPLLVPEATEWAGYVPNVVYSCGAMIHGTFLIIPYAMSDMVTTFARIELNELIGAIEGI